MRNLSPRLPEDGRFRKHDVRCKITKGGNQVFSTNLARTSRWSEPASSSSQTSVASNSEEGLAWSNGRLADVGFGPVCVSPKKDCPAKESNHLAALQRVTVAGSPGAVPPVIARRHDELSAPARPLHQQARRAATPRPVGAVDGDAGRFRRGWRFPYSL